MQLNLTNRVKKRKPCIMFVLVESMKKVGGQEHYDEKLLNLIRRII